MAIPGKSALIALLCFAGFGTMLALVFAHSGGAEPWEKPALALPETNEPCVESREAMRANHMKILEAWRDLAVREGKREFVDAKGRTQRISLQEGCLSCHADRQNFCESCHRSQGVTPYCWDCHVSPSEYTPVRRVANSQCDPARIRKASAPWLAMPTRPTEAAPIKTFEGKTPGDVTLQQDNTNSGNAIIKSNDSAVSTAPATDPQKTREHPMHEQGADADENAPAPAAKFRRKLPFMGPLERYDGS